MRLGLIARADNSGLGMQTWEFYNHMKPSKTLVVDMNGHNGNKVYPERYPTNAVWSNGIPTIGDINEFLADLDCVFVAEAPYNYYLYARAKELGVKTAVQYNYEFFDWFMYPHFPMPDMLIAPSKWHYDEVEAWAKPRGIRHQYLHCPVNRIKLPFVKRDCYKTFLHVAGRAAAHDRNGTMTVIEAAKYVQSNAQILLHFQGQQGIGHQVTHTLDDYQAVINQHNIKGNIIVRHEEFADYQDIYKGADALILPRRYGGNCLPLNEAISTGMPVLMPDISPNNQFLDRTWLMPAQKVGQFEPRTVIDIYGVQPEALAAKIDEFAGMDADRALAHNSIANTLAEAIDWDEMKRQYLDALEALCKNQ
jgi:glycosyltransferase involved in cell wall biosynthesis